MCLDQYEQLNQVIKETRVQKAGHNSFTFPRHHIGQRTDAMSFEESYGPGNVSSRICKVVEQTYQIQENDS